ncbi:aminotransferase-like domain-containing protein [Spelaeicoccus albus]|uniref:DNA-binding transcriptional MocR family regulator n=1 Tax=Spelaeicoccus albus TaxID=1280376 RepID=A0A7Z0D1P8_9MICO|nr:PLP-dependent aminotransferase family protein [Spelaeicoccus albus]NYI66582.1 DNA-binding transcriptional MocR family regulator [Spelaeicoccus albus]
MQHTWADRFASRASGLVSSEVRSLFSVASDPAYVNLAGGSPDVGALALEEIAELTRHVVATRGAEALQYGTGQGAPELREQIPVVMAEEGISASPDEIIVTTGSQQALDLVCKVFIDPGDVIIAEAPSYVGALATFRAYEADVVHVDQDADGIVPDLLAATLASLQATRRTPKLLYVIPNFQNPSGSTLAGARRREIVRIADRFGVMIVEDNPYGLISFDTDPLPALKELNPDGVVYLGSFSKIFSAGLRMGWAAAPPPVLEKLICASESSVLSPSMYSQLTVSSYLAGNNLTRQVKAFREIYRDKRDAMMLALADYLPEVRVNRPAGGFFTWLTLPDGIDSKGMLAEAMAAHVVYTPGTGFYADGRGHSNIRLSYSSPTPENIRAGIERLAGVVRHE